MSRDPNRTRTVYMGDGRRPPYVVKGRKASIQATFIPTERQIILTYSHGRWRALTRRNVQVEAHFCYTECARRAGLLGFTPVVPA